MLAVGKHFFPAEARTPADDVREALRDAERLVATLRETGPQIVQLLHLLDQIFDGLDRLEAGGMDVRVERARFETVQARLGRCKGRFLARAGGGLLPLGGDGELLGGHKGYGLALLVDVLCGVLPGALYADLVYPQTPGGTSLPSGIGHFFGALRVEAFRPLAEFTTAMDDLQRRLKGAARAEGQRRIYVHGEKEFEEAERRSRTGIPLNPKVLAELEAIAGELDVEFSPL